MPWSSVRYLPLAFVFLSLALVTGGCASKEEIAPKRKYETHDERADREVFYDNWLHPFRDGGRQGFLLPLVLEEEE